MEFFLDFLDSREPPETDVGCYVGIYVLNSVLVSRRPEMGMELGSKKSGTEVGRVGCPWTAHCWVSGLLKSIPGCVNWIKIVHMLCAQIAEMNGLVCVEIGRLRDDIVNCSSELIWGVG